MSDPELYFFGQDDASDATELGAKGANLATMTRLGLPVPPGFTIPRSIGDTYLHTRRIPTPLYGTVSAMMCRLERVSDRRFGDSERPLLVSVRGGGVASMPGMLATVLNVGLNDQTVRGLANESHDVFFAYDCYRRFMQMYGTVVYHIPIDRFEQLIPKGDLTYAQLRQVIADFKELIKHTVGRDIPHDPTRQLWEAIQAVWLSWLDPKAVSYLSVQPAPNANGSAVSIVEMVFGNRGNTSGSGVLFTRNPSTGERAVFGEFLPNAQGEDVVNGRHTPVDIRVLATFAPDTWTELLGVCMKLERAFRDMQEIEFTIERGKLFILQTRTGKRTALAALQIAVDMVAEGVIDNATAVSRVSPQQFQQLLAPTILAADRPPLVVGLPASRGVATGRVVFDADRTQSDASAGQAVILVRDETSPADIHGLIAARGVLTTRGGMTCHAAVVARDLGKCAIVNAPIHIDPARRLFTINGVTIREGEVLTLDGTTGNVYQGDVPTLPSEIIRVRQGELDPGHSHLYQMFAQLVQMANE